MCLSRPCTLSLPCRGDTWTPLVNWPLQRRTAFGRWSLASVLRWVQIMFTLCGSMYRNMYRNIQLVKINRLVHMPCQRHGIGRKSKKVKHSLHVLWTNWRTVVKLILLLDRRVVYLLHYFFISKLSNAVKCTFNLLVKLANLVSDDGCALGGWQTGCVQPIWVQLDERHQYLWTGSRSSI